MSSRPRTKYDRPEALDTLFTRVRILAAQLEDPLMAAFEVTERLSQNQVQEMFDLVMAEGAPLRGGGLGFSPAEADLVQLLAVRIGTPLVWCHVYAGPEGGMLVGEGRWVESQASEESVLPEVTLLE